MSIYIPRQAARPLRNAFDSVCNKRVTCLAYRPRQSPRQCLLRPNASTAGEQGPLVAYWPPADDAAPRLRLPV